jgi:hypothetical protein
MPEHYYTDSLKDESELNTIKKEFDRYLLSLMQDYVAKNQIEKIVDIFDSLYLSKSREIAIKFAEALNENHLVQTMATKFARWKISHEERGEKTISYKGIYNSENKASKIEELTYENGESNGNSNHIPFANYALNSNNFRNLEEEVRNELNKNGIDVEENDNEVFNSNLPAHQTESQMTVNLMFKIRITHLYIMETIQKEYTIYLKT